MFLDRKNLLVAHEMGLGKTVISIAASEKLLDEGRINCCLIVCQASLKYQWAQRIAQFTSLSSVEKKIRGETIIIPGEDCIVIDGSPGKRDEVYRILSPPGWRPRYIIISYDNLLRDSREIKKINPDMVVLDEATAIKTFKAQRTKQVKRILKSKYRLALTGTPIENRPDELFSIMQWVDEEVLGRYDLFDRAFIRRNNFGWVTGYKNLPVLRKRLGSAMSRKSRRDPDVEKFLPEVDEDNWYTDMSSDMEELYRIIARDMLTELDQISPSSSSFDVHDYYAGVDERTPSGKLMAMHLSLEMLVDHPDLIIESGLNWEKTDGKIGSKYAYHLWQQEYLDSILISPKLELLKDKLYDILLYPDNKILIYTRFRNMLDILDWELPGKKVRFHGGMSVNAKAASVAAFTHDKDCKIFLSSHAGAYGMDMSMSNYLINYDHPWSSGKADQINGRHVRASSEFSKVFIRNLIARNTVEERKVRVLSMKRAIATSVLDGYGSDSKGRLQVDGDSLRGHLDSVLEAG